MSLKDRLLGRVLRLPRPVRQLLHGRPPTIQGATLDPELHTLCVLASRVGHVEHPERSSVRAMRADSDGLDRLGPPLDPMVSWVDQPLPGTAIRARIYRAPTTPTRAAPCLVYLHGGGWVIGSLDSYNRLCAWLAGQLGAVVIAVDYRLAPEHPFPAAWDDAVSAFRAVASHAESLGIDPARIAVGGDSAGGNLSTWICRATRSDAVRPCLQWLVYPGTRLGSETASKKTFAHGFFLTVPTIDWFIDRVFGPGDLDDPRCSPLLDPDLADQPPARLVVVGFDPLRDEGIAYAGALEAAGVSTELVRYDTLPHGMINITGISPGAHAALQAEALALRHALRSCP